MQNYIGIDTQTIVAKGSERSAEQRRDMQRRCRLNEELARPSGFERFMQVLVRQNYNGIDTETIGARNGLS